MRRWSRLAARAGLFVGVGAVLLGLWPSSVGGPATYVMVQGSSMEPLLHTGDLVVAYRLPEREVGDLVVFDLGSGSRVIHRLVDRAPNGEWVTKGDNKPAVDPWTVPDSAVLGTYVVAAPGAGQVVAWVRDRPLVLALGAGLLAMLMYVPFGRLLPSRWRRPRPVVDPEAERDADERTVITLAFTGALASAVALVAMVMKQATNGPLAVVAFGSAVIAGFAGLALLVDRITRDSNVSVVEEESDEHEAVSAR